MMRFVPVAWLPCFVTLSFGAPEDFKRVESGEKIASPAVNEASGLAVSTRDPGFMWIVNDSGARPVLHLAGMDGSDRGEVAVTGTTNVDWEDLASFKLDGKSYLLIADCGDNNSRRNDCKMVIVEEPVLPKAGERLVRNIVPAWTMGFSFEDGPRDCEAVAVDAAAGKILMVTKRTKPPVVYEMPLRLKGSGAAVAKRIGETGVSPPKSFPVLPYIAQPTGMDVSSDGSLGVVVSYYGVFLFSRTPKEGWSEAFAKAPVLLEPHGMAQAESVAFSRDGKTLIVISERGDRRIIRYQR